ncbi:MAG: YbaN family protein [Pseudomonadota bacterium]
MKLVFGIAGTLFVALGIVGAFLPVLPTTPFLLLAAGCYARSSARMHQWLLESPVFGRAIRDWQEHQAIAQETRTLATVTILLSFTVSILFVLPNLPAQIIMGIIGCAAITLIYRIPTRN